MTAQLAPPSVQKFFDNTGLPLAFGLLYTYAAGTTTLQATYVDSTQTTQNTNPITLNARGECALWLDPSKVYKFNLTDALGNQIPGWPVDNIQGGFLNPTGSVIPTVDNTFTLGSSSFSWANVYIGANHAPVLDTGSGNFGYYARTTAEVTAGVTPTNFVYQGLETIDVLRYGIIPNSSGAATANTTALTALLNPSNTGPTGRLIFPNTTGADIYYFNNMIQVRDGIKMDLRQCTLNFSKTYASADNFMGWFTFIRDVSIENGSITVNYNGTTGAGNNPGPVMRIGSRQGYPFATFTSGIFDQDNLVGMGLPPMGNIVLRNLRITSNNPLAACASMILAFGGIQNMLVENIVFTGQSGGATTGFYYEFGYATTNGFPSTSQKWSSSHANRLVFRNITAKGLNTAVTSDAFAVAVVEAYNVLAENIHSDTCGGTFEYRIGEAHFFRPWTADATGAKRCCTVRNITSQGAVYTALNLNGSQPTTAGYLSDTNMTNAGLPILTPTQKVDLMHFSLDGFSVDNSVTVDGPIIMRNGTASGGVNPIVLQAECTYFNLENIEALNGSSVGIRANDASTVFPRYRIGAIRNCKVAGNTGAGISMANTESVRIENCQLGYNPLFDAVTETTQTDGVNVDCTSGRSGGVDCRGNFVTVSGAGVGYHIVGTSTVSCNISGARGTTTTTGAWDFEGVAQTSSATIADKTSYINNSNGSATFAITFTVAPTGTGGTLTVNWAATSGVYLITFQDGELRPANFTNGSAAVTWLPLLSGTPTAAGNTVDTSSKNKYLGKGCYDTSNTRLMIAQGPNPTDNWVRADGGATVTPA